MANEDLPPSLRESGDVPPSMRSDDQQPPSMRSSETPSQTFERDRSYRAGEEVPAEGKAFMGLESAAGGFFLPELPGQIYRAGKAIGRIPKTIEGMMEAIKTGGGAPEIPFESPMDSAIKQTDSGKSITLRGTAPSSYQAFQEKIDSIEEELHTRGVKYQDWEKERPDLKDLYDKRDAIGQKELEGDHAFLKGKILKTGISDEKADEILKDVYSLDPKSQGGQFMAGKYAQKAIDDRAGSEEAIFKKLYYGPNEQNPNVSNDILAESNASPLTPEGKQKLIRSLKDKAKSVADAVHSDLQIDPKEMVNQVAKKLVDKVSPEYAGPDTEIIDHDTKVSLSPKVLNVPEAMVDSSPKLKGTDTAPALKPEIIPGTRSFSQEVYNRLLVPAAEAVAKQGQFGQLLANDMRFIRDYPSVKYGMDFGAPFEEMYNKIPDALKEEVGQNLSAALEGKAHDTTKVPPGMLPFVRDALKKISDEAIELGMKVVRHEPIPEEERAPGGPTWTPKMVDFAPRENYFPRVVKQEILEDIVREDRGRMNEMAQHMLKSRQAPTFNAAMENIRLWRKNLLDRKYGNLERARELDLPPKFYETNAFKVIPYYMKTAMQRLAEVRVFGHNDSNALMKIEGISREGHDADLALRTFRRVTGRDPIDAVAKGAFRAMRNWATGSLIQFQTTLYHLPRTIYPAMEAGYLRAAKAFVQSFGEASEIESRKMGLNLTHAMSEYLQEEYGGGGKTMSGKFANAAMTIEGIKPLDRFDRKFSGILGKDWVQNDLVKTLLKSPGNKRSRVGLQNLGIDPEKIISDKGISELDLNVAAKRFSDRTQGAPDPTTLPLWWTSPAGKMYAQFKNFMYVISREMTSVIGRAAESKDVATMARMATLPMAGAAVYGMRHSLGMKDTQYVQDPKINMALNILRDTAPLPVGVDVFFKILQGKKGVHDLLIPPSMGSAADLLGDIGESISKGKVSKAAKKDILRHVPLVGTALSHTVK